MDSSIGQAARAQAQAFRDAVDVGMFYIASCIEYYFWLFLVWLLIVIVE
jgi:hypothetical protein